MWPVNSCWTCSNARNIGFSPIRYTQYQLRYWSENHPFSNRQSLLCAWLTSGTIKTETDRKLQFLFKNRPKATENPKMATIAALQTLHRMGTYYICHKFHTSYQPQSAAIQVRKWVKKEQLVSEMHSMCNRHEKGRRKRRLLRCWLRIVSDGADMTLSVSVPQWLEKLDRQWLKGGCGK